MEFSLRSFCSAFLIIVCMSSGIIGTENLPEVFTATISGMECSLYLVSEEEGKKLDTEKSLVECKTNSKVFVKSAIVINDNTDNIFKLKLVARVKKTKFIKGKRLPKPQDMNLASKSIQHQGPSDEPVDLDEVIQRLRSGLKNVTTTKPGILANCTYNDPNAVDWSPCQTTGIRFKVLRLIKTKSSRGCFKFRTMSNKCKGGSRGYRIMPPQKQITPVRMAKELNESTENDTNAVFISGYQIIFPVEDNIPIVNSEIDTENFDDLSSGIMVEGDILTFPSSPGKSNRNARVGQTWPNNELFYEFDGTVGGHQRNCIILALGLLQSKLGCIKFVQRNYGNRVKVTNIADGCYATAGYQSRAPQDLNLEDSRCSNNGVIQHEFLHALGLMHTQSRDDRNDYVTVDPNNICCPLGGRKRRNGNIFHCPPKPNYCPTDDCRKSQFLRCQDGNLYCSSYDLPYDYLSVMHYGKNSFTNGNGPTIVTKDSYWRDRIGQRDGASFGDVQLVQRLYSCPVAIQWKGKWGNFPSSPSFCVSGTFVFGYNLRSESGQGGGDDTALNSMALYCKRPHDPIYSAISNPLITHLGFWGSWGYHAAFCDFTSPVVGFDVREEGAQGGGDDTALNDVDLWCMNGDYISASKNTNWGNWKPVQKCPSGYAVTGMRLQIEGQQGGGDDTALNGVELFCEPYP